jgi:Zn-finger nucleic acid-binding protein
MSAHCLFCGGRLDDVTRICGGCRVTSATVAEKRVGARCPRCRDVRLRQVALGTVALQRCGKCQGSFLPASEWDQLLDSFQEEPLPDEVESPYRGRSRGASNVEEAASTPNLDPLVACPTCEAEMNRFEFNGVSSIMVDVCRLHGIWLDGGEVGLVVENARTSPHATTRIDQEKLENELRQEMVDSIPPEPSVGSLLARRFAAIARRFLAK